MAIVAHCKINYFTVVRVRATIMAYTTYVLSARQVLARLHSAYMHLLSLQAKELYEVRHLILFT